MSESILQTPQLLISGKIRGCIQFEESKSIYVKYEIVYGDGWKVQKGNTKGESFESIMELNKYQETLIEQPIDISFLSKEIRGWPKILMEVWQVDKNDRHHIAGYTQANFPFKPGRHVLHSSCWVPQYSFFDNISSTYPELLYPQIIISSESRNGFQVQTTGQVILEIQILAKDFQYHGINLG